MQFLSTFFNGLINLGSPVFLTIILTLIGIIFGMKPIKAFAAGLTLGVGLTGMNIIMGFMSGSVGTAAQAFIKNTGVSLSALDMGWAPALGLAWTWKFAMLMYPVQIGINILMLALKQTTCVNVDMWNVGNKVCTAFLVTSVCGNPYVGFAIAAIEIVAELKNADLTRYRLQKLTGVPNVSMPHPMFLTCIWLYPLNWLLDKIIPNKVTWDAQSLKDKIGPLGENHVMGFIIGCLIGIFAKYSYKDVLVLGVQAGAALTLFPMVAKLFMTALTPISEYATEFMKKRFHGQTYTIGLDWPILAGRPEHWLIMTVTIPIILLFAVLLPGNMVLPFGGILDICLVVPLFYITMGNLPKMLIGTIIGTPFYLWIASFFAPYFTQLANATGGIQNLPQGQMLAWFGIDISELRYIFATAADLQPVGLILVAVTIVLAYFYVKGMKKEEKKFMEELGIISVSSSEKTVNA